MNEVEVLMTDSRAADETFNITRNGFQSEHFQVPADIDWHDDKDVGI